MRSTLFNIGDSTCRGNYCGRLNRRARILAAVLIVGAGLSGCQSMSVNSAQLRVIDASTNTGTIDSYQDNAALAYNLDYGTVTSYVSMASGSSTFAIDKAGTRQTLVSSKSALDAGKQYTEVVAGSIVNLQQAVFVDQSTPAPAGMIAVRLINEATHAGAVDVYLVPFQGKLANVSPFATNLSIGYNSGYINVPAGTYAIDVLSSGAGRSSSSVKLLSGAQVEYASGSVRTVVLIDQDSSGADGQPVSLGVRAIVADDADAQ